MRGSLLGWFLTDIVFITTSAIWQFSFPFSGFPGTWKPGKGIYTKISEGLH
jgi:hypothetical protein